MNIITILGNALKVLRDFVTICRIELFPAPKRKPVVLTSTVLVSFDSHGFNPKSSKTPGKIKIERVKLTFAKMANLASKTLRKMTFVSFSPDVAAWLKASERDQLDMGIALLREVILPKLSAIGLNLVGNRYLDGFAFDDGIKRAVLMFHKDGATGFALALATSLFEKPLAIVKDNTVKFMNYIWAGCQVKFGKLAVKFRYVPVHGGGTDGVSVTTLSYLQKISPEFAVEIESSKSYLAKVQGFADVNGYICPVKGCILVLRNEVELKVMWPELSWLEVSTSICTTENELKLIPDSLMINDVCNGFIGLINMSGESNLQKASWRTNAQLLARTVLADTAFAQDILNKSAVEKLEAIQSYAGYLQTTMKLGSGDFDEAGDLDFKASRLATRMVASQLAMGIPFAAFEQKNGESVALNILKGALKAVVTSLPRIKIPGSYFYPMVDSRMVQGFNIAISPRMAVELPIRWKLKDATPFRTGEKLATNRSPHIGSGYLSITVNVIPELGEFDGIVISKGVATLLGADCDGDRISLSVLMLGDIINAQNIPSDKYANSILV